MLLAGCAYFRSVPDNAEAFKEGLSCHMPKGEVERWASANKMEPLSCTPAPSRDEPYSCDSGTERVVYRLLFDDQDELISVQPGYIYDLTHLIYEGSVDLCEKHGE